MFQVLEQMKLDMANFQLQMLKPQLKAHAAEYEREKFQQLLESSHGHYFTVFAMSEALLTCPDR